eukprot:scpid21092/ scgid33068/ Myotubularin-related protein 3; FYVE domain-containing dual specificity protein phosphatase 1; Zinc finger FYVE domain-containing protein 10
MADLPTSIQFDQEAVVLRKSELFPKKNCIHDDEPVENITPPMHGESFLFCGRCGKDNSQVILLTTYRLLMLQPKQWFAIAPVGILLSIDQHDNSLLVKFKDGRHCIIQFSSTERCLLWQHRLSAAIPPPAKLQDHFAFAFHAWLFDSVGQLCQQTPNNLEWFYQEIRRLGFYDHPLWRTTDCNIEFRVCPTYPQLSIVPASMKEDNVRTAAKFRILSRFPAVVWRHASNGAVLARCSQPLIGLLGYQRCGEDEKMIEGIAKAVVLDRALVNKVITKEEAVRCVNESSCKLKTLLGEEKATRIDMPSLLVVDMRTYAAAMANRSKGGGTESKDYYPCIEPVFHKIPNIHSVLQSYEAMSTLCQTQSTNSQSWMSQLESTQWLHFLSALLESAVHIAHTLCVDARPVLVHCSDGWDRTAQATSLSQLLVDPFYRTFEGFTTLIKREWLGFGHKFADRCGHSTHAEPSPVFVQWLDAVHQVMHQFPLAFEYNENFLVKLAEHVYSRLFSNFLCNCEKDRIANALKAKTLDVFMVLSKDRKDFVNYLYDRDHHALLVPGFGVQHMVLWKRMYLRPVRNIMPGGSDAREGPRVQPTSSAVAFPSYEIESSYDASLRLSLAPGAVPERGSLLECLQTQQRNINQELQRHGAEPRRTHSTPPADRGHYSQLSKASPISASDDRISSKMSASPAQSIPTTGSQRTSGKTIRRVSSSDGLCGSYEYLSWSSPKTSKLHSHTDYHPPPITAAQAAATAAAAGSVSSGSAAAAANGFHVASAKVVTTPQRRRAAEQLADVQVVQEALSGDASSLELSPTLAQEPAQSVMTSSNEEVTTPRNELSTSTECVSPSSSSPVTVCATSHATCIPVGRRSSPSPEESERERWPMSLPELRETDQELTAASSDVPDGKKDGASLRQRCGQEARAKPEDDSGCPSSPSSPTSSNLESTVVEGEYAQADWLVPQFMLDVDGLPMLQDPVQALLQRNEQQHEAELSGLEAKIEHLNHLLRQATAQCLSDEQHRDLSAALADDMERKSSVSSDKSDMSSTASSVAHSWEAVDSNEGQPIRWVPDHAAKECMGCGSMFWGLLLRRHHCRNCGGVFCYSCSCYSVPVPSEQLSNPVRVCRTCYDKLDGPRYERQIELQHQLLAASS